MANVKICDRCETMIREGDMWGQYSSRSNGSLIERDFDRKIIEVKELCASCFGRLADAMETD